MKEKLLFNFIEDASPANLGSICLKGKISNSWKGYTLQEIKETVIALASDLKAAGLKKGDCVAIISNNRPEWIIADTAIMKVGGIVVPIYINVSDQELQHIFQDANIKFCFAEDKILSDRVKGFLSHEHIFCFENDQGYVSLSELLGEYLHHDVFVENIAIQASEIATIIYTSGTTGKPKGVMLTHQNLMSNIFACKPLLPVNSGDRALSFLPIAHVFERMLVYLYLHAGVIVHFSPSLDHISEDIKAVKPHIFTAVPRIIEKFIEAIQRSSQKSSFSKYLLSKALNIASHFPKKPFGHVFAEQLVFKKIRSNLGSQLKCIISGSAALDKQLNRTFWGIGIPIFEGYGLTETSPVISVNYPNNYRFDTVGKPIPGVEVKISQEEEILVRGSNVMKGYFNQPETTKEVIDEEGFFQTGDLGMIDKDGYVKITGRKKELFKTSGGKYINPVAIENLFKNSHFIDSIMVIGENRKFPSALIVPNFSAIRNYLKLTNQINEQIISDPKIRELFDKEIARFNEKLGHWEQLKKYKLLSDPWTVETGELTPKLSLKRKIIIIKFQKEVNEIYT